MIKRKKLGSSKECVCDRSEMEEKKVRKRNQWEQIDQASQSETAVQDKSFCPAFYKKRAPGGRCSFGFDRTERLHARPVRWITWITGLTLFWARFKFVLTALDFILWYGRIYLGKFMEIEKSKLYLVRLVFKNKIFSLNGSAFENFALSVLKLKYPNLKRTKPDGREGDWAADAICMEEGIYFQVYGPEFKDKDSLLADAKKKIDRNFKRLFSKWKEAGFQVKEWHFVLNEKYSGAYPELFQKTNEIKIENNLERSGLILSADLEDLLLDFYTKSPQEVELLLDSPVLSINEETLIRFDSMGPLHEACEYISRNDKAEGFEFLNNEPAEVDEKKIDRNQLCPQIGRYILTSLDKVELVNKFFESNSDFISEEIREIIIKAYEKVAKKYSDPNQVFIKLLEDLGGDWKNKVYLNSALMILVSYYFQLCDIFER